MKAFHSPRALSLWLLCFAVACSGSIETGESDPGMGGSRAGGAPGTGDKPGGAAGVPPPVDCTAAKVLPSPLRRLSHAEYQATLRDLFPDVTLDQPRLVKDPIDKGFENRATLLNPTSLLVENYSETAASVAVKVVASAAALKQVLPCTPTAGQEDACADQFITAFGARAFRRPVSAEERTALAAFFKTERTANDFNGAVQLTLEAMLQSPQILYRFEFGDGPGADDAYLTLTPHEVASRLSYLLWGSLPDQELLDAAKSGELQTTQQREMQARRMLSDPRAAGMMIDFHRQWLDLDRIDHEPKDPKTYPDYAGTLKASVREESNRFVKRTMFEGAGSLEAFLTSPQTEVDAALAKLYGVAAPASGWHQVTLDPEQRAGFLTRANFLAARSHQVAGSPPLRAVFIMERFFCEHPPEPPVDADTSDPQAMAGVGGKKTNRQLFEARLEQSTTCKGCHSAFDPVGYALETYNAVGGFQTTDNGLPVDATAEIAMGDVTGKVTGGVELSRLVAGSKQVQACAVTEWYQFAQGRIQDTADECRLELLKAATATAGGNIREALVLLAASPEFIHRTPVK